MKKILFLSVLVLACDDGTGPDPDPGPDPVAGLRAVVVTDDLEAPIHLTSPPGDARLFVVEQPGRIRIIEAGELLPEPFLDITDDVGYGGERGLFSMAFDPDYATTGWFWVNYTDNAGDTRIVRYTVSGDPNVADAGSNMPVLHVEQPESNHNGGQIAFGPDGMLFIGMGDGGGGGDPDGNGQDLTTLLGDMLRLDVRGAEPYAIPDDNPYRTSTTAEPEIWASGLRNPWRFSFDEETGMLYVADVGQRLWEEINAVEADEPAVNYGWDVMEGRHCYDADTCNQAGLTLPVHEYPHTEGCSVTGGHVYRGENLTGLQGHYFYSDYCSGWVRSFRLSGGSAADHRKWDVGDLGNVLSFGVDSSGELYVLSSTGTVYRLDPVETTTD